jgi:hypothetical protein
MALDRHLPVGLFSVFINASFPFGLSSFVSHLKLSHPFMSACDVAKAASITFEHVYIATIVTEKRKGV